MNITVYLIAYNESYMLPHAVAHYRQQAPGCRIIVYDNFSTDNTRAIALELGCEVRSFYTADSMSDQALLNVKNNCWKIDRSDWVIVCDVDEHLSIPQDLPETNATIFDCEIIDMLGEPPSRYGVRHNHHPKKMMLFRPDRIESINFGFGCHTAMPIGNLVFGKSPDVWHYKYISPEVILNRNKVVGKRLSQDNKAKGLSFHYLYGKLKINKIFRALGKQITEIR